MKSIIKLGLLCYTFFNCLNINILSAMDSCDLVLNGDFSNGIEEWIAVLDTSKGVVGRPPLINQNIGFQIDALGVDIYDISLQQRGVHIEKGESYQIRFEAKAETERPIIVSVSDIGNGYATLSKSNKNFTLKKEWTVYEYSFNADTTDNTARLIFMLGLSSADVVFDNISMVKLNCENCLSAGTPCDDNDACTVNDKEDGLCNCVGELTTNNQIINGDFSNRLSPWHKTIINRNTNPGYISELDISKQEAHFEINQFGPEKWTVSLEQRKLSIEANQHYKISFNAKASKAREINMEITNVGDGFGTLFSKDVELEENFKHYTFDYTPEFTKENVRIIFYLGIDTPDVTIDDVRFETYNCEPCEDYRQACDDGDPCTINDYYNASCDCVSYTKKEQYIKNGNFSYQFAGWSETIFENAGAIAESNYDNELAHFKIEQDGTKNWHISLEQRGIPFVAGQKYAISFRAKAAISRKMNMKISDYPNASHTYFNKNLFLTEDWQVYKYIYTPESTDNFTRIIFNMGVDEMNTCANEIFIDDVSITNRACSVYNPVYPQDSLVLLQFYKQSCKTDCDLDWNLSRPVHTWEGVEIEHSRVVGLYVASKGLSGSIPFVNLTLLRALDLSGNNFSGELPDISKLQLLNRFDISKNRLSFNTVEAKLETNAFINNFIYSPQYIGNDETYILNTGDDKTLQLISKMIINNKNFSFEWKQNDEVITGANSPTYILTNMKLEDIGSYTLHITNENLVPGMEIILKPQNLLLSGYDINGQEIYNNEIMVLFDNVEERNLFDNKYLNSPYNGRVSFQCDCNRLLYLYQFESSEQASKVLLEIDKKRQAITSKGVPLGNPNQAYRGDVNSFENTTESIQNWKWPKSDDINLNDLVNVYLLDTGLDVNNLGNVNFLMEEAPTSCFNNTKAPGYSFVTNQNKISSFYDDTNGHGTYGYYAITGGKDNNSNLKVIPIKLFDESGKGTMFHFVCGLFHSIDSNADIINVSAGFKGGNSAILEKALQIAQQKGIFITAAAGNDGLNMDSIPQYPAHYAGQFYQKQRLDLSGQPSLDENGKPVFDSIPYDNIISIAALNSENEIADFSNYSDQSVTLSAYGENLVGYGLNAEQVTYSGTSMATFFTTRELVNEMAKNKNRSYQQIWSDFEENYLVINSNTEGKTITGKQLNVNLEYSKPNTKLGKTAITLPMLYTFPNPSNGKINVVINCNNNFPNKTNVQISVFDISGVEMENQIVTCDTRIQLDISAFAKGTYLMKATNNSINYYSKFIVR